MKGGLPHLGKEGEPEPVPLGAVVIGHLPAVTQGGEGATEINQQIGLGLHVDLGVVEAVGPLIQIDGLLQKPSTGLTGGALAHLKDPPQGHVAEGALGPQLDGPLEVFGGPLQRIGGQRLGVGG